MRDEGEVMSSSKWRNPRDNSSMTKTHSPARTSGRWTWRGMRRRSRPSLYPPVMPPPEEGDEDEKGDSEVGIHEKAKLREMQKLKKQKVQEILNAQNAAIDADMGTACF